VNAQDGVGAAVRDEHGGAADVQAERVGQGVHRLAADELHLAVRVDPALVRQQVGEHARSRPVSAAVRTLAPRNAGVGVPGGMSGGASPSAT
jgi:hypothetical protein